MKRSLQIVLGMALAALVSSCSSLTIEHVQYGWPVESVLTVSSDNMVLDGHNAVSFRVAELAESEFQDSTALTGKQIRLLRSSEGYYFLTGQGFRNVYVLAAGEGTLNLKNKIEVAPNGLKEPALNQRSPYVELLDGKEKPRKLTSSEVVQEEKQ